MNIPWIIIQFIIAFGVMVFLHELGHFLMAKLFKVEVEEFGIGMPPRALKLFTWQGTLFSLNWLPFGAFVKPKGEFGDDQSEGGFKSSKPWQQLLIYLAGPFMNLLTAFVIYAIIIMNVGYPDNTRTWIESVAPHSPAEAAGLQPGDHILEIAGTPVTDMMLVTSMTKQNLGKEMTLVIARNGENQSITVVPDANPPQGRGAMGIVLTHPMLQYPFFTGVKAAGENTLYMIKQYVIGIGTMISGKMEMGLESIVGPVGMFTFYQDAAEMDREAKLQQQHEQKPEIGEKTLKDVQMPWMNRLSFFAIISIALGVTNLFPIPALDGGRILFLLPELFFKKKFPAKVEYYYNAIGMVFLLALMAVILFKDVFMIAKGS